MKQQTTAPKGIYAGLSPADFVMAVRRPPLGQKLRAAALIATAAPRNDCPGTPPNTIKT